MATDPDKENRHPNVPYGYEFARPEGADEVSCCETVLAKLDSLIYFVETRLCSGDNGETVHLLD